MFGDRPIICNKEMNVDIRGRLFLPSITGREPGDKVVLIYDEDIDKYKLYSDKNIGEIMSEIEKLALSAKTKEDVIYYKNQLIDFAKKIVVSTAIDGQCRVSLGDTFKNVQLIRAVGCGSHLLIEKLKER